MISGISHVVEFGHWNHSSQTVIKIRMRGSLSHNNLYFRIYYLKVIVNYSVYSVWQPETDLCHRSGPADPPSPQTSGRASRSAPLPPQEPLLSGTSWRTRARKRLRRWNRLTHTQTKEMCDVSLSRNSNIDQAQCVSGGPWAGESISKLAVYYTSLCVCSSFFSCLGDSLAGELISVTARQKCWVELRLVVQLWLEWSQINK